MFPLGPVFCIAKALVLCFFFLGFFVCLFIRSFCVLVVSSVVFPCLVLFGGFSCFVFATVDRVFVTGMIRVLFGVFVAAFLILFFVAGLFFPGCFFFFTPFSLRQTGYVVFSLPQWLWRRGSWVFWFYSVTLKLFPLVLSLHPSGWRQSVSFVVVVVTFSSGPSVYRSFPSLSFRFWGFGSLSRVSFCLCSVSSRLYFFLLFPGCSGRSFWSGLRACFPLGVFPFQSVN
ncbi:hypothetical protein G740_04705 [Escherichia coli HVH 77 (4-2605759)]|nr:hypothetical protein G740_04705 [Escherichia coli HVH 77 (4-2605759)]